MGQDGFDNEVLIMNAINNKKYSELNKNLKNMVEYIYSEEIKLDSIFHVYKKGGVQKTDLVIEMENKSFNISIKKGTGNSIHQENVEEFIDFLNQKYNISNDLANNIRLFIWGDGTLDGSGLVSDRINARQFKLMYPNETNLIREFFHNHKKDLIERFLIKGAKSDSDPDFMYYGTPEKGVIVKAVDALNWLSDDKNEKITAPIPVGRLTFQAWNRNINGGDKSENKRGVIQLKWSSVGSDLKIISEGF